MAISDIEKVLMMRPPSTWWPWRDGIAFVAQSCLLRFKSLLLLMHDFSSAAVLSPTAALVAHAGR